MTERLTLGELKWENTGLNKIGVNLLVNPFSYKFLKCT